jgi:hypothetical protein
MCPVHSRSLRRVGSTTLQRSHRREPKPSGLGKVSSKVKAFRPGLTPPICFVTGHDFSHAEPYSPPRSVILNGARLGPRSHVSAMGVSEVKDLLLLLRKPQSPRKWVPRPFAFFANGWECKTLRLVPKRVLQPTIILAVLWISRLLPEE